MLAQDLNYHLRQNPTNRFVLFIDEYERVFDQSGAGAVWEENEFDQHMRSFVRYTNGLLAVFFSRERLPWEELRDWCDELKDNQHLLGGLADKDADNFLKAIPIDDEAIRKAIIDGARESPASGSAIYPLMLDLMVEHWRSLAAKCEAYPDRFKVTAGTFSDRRRKIINRVLGNYGVPLQTTIERLSVSRRFDYDAFRCIIETFHTALPADTFERIAKLSFVTKIDDGFLIV